MSVPFSGQRNIVCSVCANRFATVAALAAHKKICSYKDCISISILDLDINDDELAGNDLATSKPPTTRQNIDSATIQAPSGTPLTEKFGKNAVQKNSMVQTHSTMNSDHNALSNQQLVPNRSESRQSLAERSDVTTYVTDSGDDSAVDIADIWLPTEGTKEEEPLSSKKGPIVEIEKPGQTINPKTKEAINMMKSLPQGVTWDHVEYRGHTWSVVPKNLCKAVHRVLQKLCHEPLDLYDAKYTLHRHTPEAIARMQKCYVCSGMNDPYWLLN
jgi:hypothetical protein